MMKVIIESPYAGDVEANLRYLRACLRDSLLRGEAPFASHAVYTQIGVLNDTYPEERDRGIQAGFAWRQVADVTVFYVDRGVSGGMLLAAKHLGETGGAYEFRSLTTEPNDPVLGAQLQDSCAKHEWEVARQCRQKILEVLIAAKERAQDKRVAEATR